MRRKTNWAGWLPTGFSVSPLTYAVLTLKPPQMDPGEESTLVRTRGDLVVTFLTGAQSRNPANFAAGLTIVSDDAAGVGASAIPSPTSSPNADWLWYFAGATKGLNAFDSESSRFEVDSKAMRKVHEQNKTLAFVFSNRDAIDTLIVHWNARLLFKLS